MGNLSARSVTQVLLARPLFFVIGILSIVVAIAGFWPRYFGPLLTGTAEKIPVIHLHAAVYVGWLTIFIAQAWLAASGRISLHMRFGRIAMVYGLFVIAVGLITGLTMFGIRIENGEIELAKQRLFAPLTDMLIFAPLLAAAWVYRRKPEIHKRLIVVATTYLLIPAVFRMIFLGGNPPPLPQFFAVWLAPIYLAMTHDFVTRRLVHPVFLMGIAVLVLSRFRAPLRDTGAWVNFGDWLVDLYA